MSKTIVVLIHGIRTAAWWQSRVATVFEGAPDVKVIPLKYGYFDLVRFLCPFGVCRRAPIERLRKQLEGIRQKYPGHRLVVFAHSYGTYALSKILMENPYFTFDRVVLCGSIISEGYDWNRVDNQILFADKRDAIINECGTRDIWPVLAKSVSWGYGASGTYGFGAFNVRDRFHELTHSQFFEDAFIRQHWLPIVTDQPIAFSTGDKAGLAAPAWFGLLRVPLRWLAVSVAVIALTLVAPYRIWDTVFDRLQDLLPPEDNVVTAITGPVAGARIGPLTPPQPISSAPLPSLAVKPDTLLRTIIGQLQAGTPPQFAMAPRLRDAVMAQMDPMTIMLRKKGEITGMQLAYQHMAPDGGNLYNFDVMFSGGRTVWQLGLAPDGLLTALWFDER